MILRVEIEQEEDGRWIADVVDLPGVMVYGSSARQAVASVKALALRVLADRMEAGEEVDAVTFEEREPLAV
jgi:predicted RNase H-like HicB family nuclease